MILVLCLPCAFAIRIMPANLTDVPTVQELDHLVGRQSTFWPDQYVCPRCDKPARGILEAEADPRVLQVMTLRDLTTQEAFAAFHGLGLPEEQQCSIELIQSLLRMHPIRTAKGKNVTGSNYAILDALELWDGTVLHLGSAPDGAVVFRISRPQSHVARVLSEGTS